ncbi:MAG: acyl-CoA thioesterase domain-containing protein, partial [Pseudomonadota bacterium]
MSDPVGELLELLDLERLEVDLFRGESPDETTSQRVFGGQVIAQALVAAYKTVDDRQCHSLHAYFIRPGDPKIPIIY